MRKPDKNIWQPNQNQCRIGMLIQEEPAGRQCDLGAMVASHAVNSDSDHEKLMQTDFGRQIPRI